MRGTLIRTALYVALGALPWLTTAQPVVFNTDRPSIGDARTYATASYLINLTSGPDQVWDASSVNVTGSFIENWEEVTYLDPWPDISIRRNNVSGGHDYFEYSETATFWRGRIGGGSLICDTLRVMTFPCTMGTSWNSSGECVHSGAWVESHDIAAVADGYGTLLLPTGPMDNVLRVTMQRTYTYTFQTVNYAYKDSLQLFYRPGITTFLAQNRMFLGSVNGEPFQVIGEPSFQYLSDGSTSINDAADNTIPIILYTDPGTGSVLVEYSTKGDVVLDVFDQSGRLVRHEALVNNMPGVHRHRLDLSGLASGLYTLRLVDRTGASGVRRWVVE